MNQATSRGSVANGVLPTESIPTLQEEQRPVDVAIVRELVELSPEWWDSVALDVTRSVVDGVEKHSHVISSPDGHRDAVIPSEALFEATYRLSQLFAGRGRAWERVSYVARQLADGSWSYQASFHYPVQAST